ncbi:MAG TPA: hypothetical protein VFN10_23100 [Thermoanaerobaculia bacterium]|nr:hypothetical protein [Thermoanaerobaculia bacterium]
MITLAAVLLLATGAHRNLFAYVDPPAPSPAPARVVRTQMPIAPPPVVIAAAAPAAAQPPAAPRFEWRYIGRFGTDADPIAAFTRDREVRTLRRGERLGEFTLRAIGIESVEMVAAAGAQTIQLHDQERPLPH